jgi:PIN domain nuclease of toxin-antitoxin system
MSDAGDGVVVDASAVLALLRDEPFGDFDPERLIGAYISAVNLSEVLARLQSAGLNEAEAELAAGALDLRVIPFDARQAQVTASLWSRTRSMGLSLADRACLALCLTLGKPAVTADRIWAQVDLGVDIVLIR